MSLEICSLASGSKGNSQYIASPKTKILLDAGMSGKYIQNALSKINKKGQEIDAILVTHEHSDHISGVGVLMRRFNLPLYVNQRTWDEMKEKIGKIDLERVNIIKNNQKFIINDLIIKPYEISHDAADPIGYMFENNQKRIAVITDSGYISNRLLEEIKESDLLYLEANHDEEMLKAGSYPYFLKRRILSMEGHLSNEAAGEVAKAVVKHGRVRNILLAHLSQENNFPELAYKTVENSLSEINAVIGKDVNLGMTKRNDVSKLYKVGEVFEG